MTKFAPKRILSAVDFSPVSRQILEWAVRLATPFAATIEVLHADWWEPPNYFTHSQLKSLVAESKAARSELEQQLEHTTRTITGGRVPHEVSVVDGHPVPAILRRVAESSPGLLVLGSHGRTGVSRLMLGSVSENVVRQVGVPTLVVRGAPPATGGHVLCPVTMVSRSLRYVELAAGVASAMGAHLEVLHSVEALDPDVRAAHDRLCEFVPANLRGQCDIRESVRAGNAAEQIILAAREQASDLIVLGAEHRPFLEMTAWGTTTDHVLRHSPCSVLVLPWRAAEGA